MSWSYLTDWWLHEIADDHAYTEVVTPLLLEVLRPQPGARYLDLGCGEGRIMRVLEAEDVTVHGVDINPELAALAGVAVVAKLPDIPMRDRSYDGVYSVLSLDHIEDHGAFFTETARVTRPDGHMALVANHPTWTAPDSTPITDDDGEVLWRPGEYFSSGWSEVPAGEGSVVFHHRSMSDLLNAAATAGWSMEQMIERPHHELEDQAGIPRLLACRWRFMG